MNRVILSGHLTRDPELTKTASDISVCKFGLAVKRRFGDETDFFNIVAWRGTADNCAKFLHKGDKIALVGSVQVRSYEANDGTRRTAVDIVAEEVEFLNTKGEGQPKAYEPRAVEPKQVSMVEVTDEQLPF